MDAHAFDELTRLFANSLTRRRLSRLATAFGMTFGVVRAPQLILEADARKKSNRKRKRRDAPSTDAKKSGKKGKKKGKKKKPPTPPTPPAPPPPCIPNCAGGCGAMDGCGGFCQSGTCPNGQICVGGACQGNCPGTLCGDVCVDIQANSRHCGACNQPCSGDLRCVQGQCLCPADTRCGDLCVDLQTNPNHCAACDAPCQIGQTCIAGECTGCPSSQKLCGAECVPGHFCCGDGECNGGKTCQSGACACPESSTECEGRCVITLTDPHHCGQCDKSCPSGTCIGGLCTEPEVCDRSDNDLDGETDEGDICPENKVCREGVCVCPQDMEDCNGDGACELLGTADHCTRCNDACLHNAECLDGVCGCPSSKRLCGDRCIPIDDCCQDDECAGELVCRVHVLVQGARSVAETAASQWMGAAPVTSAPAAASAGKTLASARKA